MRALRILPRLRRIDLVEGNVEELVSEQVQPPRGMLDLSPGLALISCMVGAIGSTADLFWHHGAGEVFGGLAFIVGLDNAGYVASLPLDAWGAWRDVEFLGQGDEALPRLRYLCIGQLAFENADPRQGVLKLH